jgi:hypothetical protein
MNKFSQTAIKLPDYTLSNKIWPRKIEKTNNIQSKRK